MTKFARPDTFSGDALKAETMLLFRGGAILLFSRLARALEPSATAETDQGMADWTSVSWRHQADWCGVAFLSIPTPAPFGLNLPAECSVQVVPSHRLREGLSPLAEFLRRHDGPLHAVLKALSAAPLPGVSGEAELEILKFLVEATETAGFVELQAVPEYGGVFLQGWVSDMPSDATLVFGAAGALGVKVAGFSRHDVLAPAVGICLYAKDWPQDVEIGSAIFLVSEDRILRLNLVPEGALIAEPDAAAAHIREMLPRLHTDVTTIATFSRICRPKFYGQDSLADYSGPIAAAFDRILLAPNGDLFVSGWLLDPLALVDRVLIKNTSNLYAPLHERWHRLSRPDLNEGYAQEPRFHGLLNPRETRHGFLCQISSGSENPEDAQLYLELVLTSGDCLFQPLTATRCRDADTAHLVVALVPASEPALNAIIDDHVSPFLAALPVPCRRARAPRLYPLGGGLQNKPVAALIDPSHPDHLKLLMSELCDTPDAALLDLVLVIDDTVQSALLEDLDDLFHFYGLSGGMVLLPRHGTSTARHDMAAATVTADQVLLWHTSALPKRPGWLVALREDAEALNSPCLISPVLCHADGTVHYSSARPGDTLGGRFGTATSSGMPTRRTGRVVPMSSGAAEVALIDRALLDRVGGFSGPLLGDSHSQHDLGARLRMAESGAWCSSGAEFWMLQDKLSPDRDPQDAIVDRIDAALVARRYAQQPVVLVA